MVVNGDCLEWLRTQQSASVRCIFADPPDAIGLKYNSYDDSFKGPRYYDWLELVILESMRVADVVWMSYNAVHDFEIKSRVLHALRNYRPSWSYKSFVQYFTFGQHNAVDFGNNHRPLIRLRRPGVTTDTSAIMVESVRQKIGDSRANPDGRVPGDVFDFPRVTGNSHQRRSWHPTQLNEDMIELIVKSSGPYGPADLGTKLTGVVDLFLGSGTTGIVCQRLGIPWTGIEIDEFYCRKAQEWLPKSPNTFG